MPNSHTSYSEAIREPHTLMQKNSLETAMETLIQTINSFIHNMQGIMQELLRNQGMLLQALVGNK